MIAPGRAIAGMASRHPRPMLAVGASLAAFGALALARGDQRYWAFLVVMTVLTAIVAMVDHTVRISRALAWALAGLGVLHLAGGLLPAIEGPTFYETWLIRGVLKFDQAVHFYGSAVSTLFAWQVLGRYVDPARATERAHALLAAGFGLGKGALNEVIEFFLGASVSGVYPGTALNTQWDLVFNLGGVVAAALYLRAGFVDRHLAGEHEGEYQGEHPARAQPQPFL